MKHPKTFFLNKPYFYSALGQVVSVTPRPGLVTTDSDDKTINNIVIDYKLYFID